MNEDQSQNPSPDENTPTPEPQPSPAGPNEPQYPAQPRPSFGAPAAGVGYPPYAPQPPPRRSYLIPISLVVGCLPWVILFGLALGGIIGSVGNESYGKHVALIRVTGVITAGKSGAGHVRWNGCRVRRFDRSARKSSQRQWSEGGSHPDQQPRGQSFGFRGGLQRDTACSEIGQAGLRING